MKLACAIDEVKRLSPDKIKAVLDGDSTGEYLLLDVRQPEEYQAGHIPGAMLIPLGELEARQGELPRGRRIITYCRSGHRSMAAAIALCGLGFEGLHHLDGGILNWPYQTITGMPAEGPELVTESANAGDILMLAIKLEKGSREFYVAAKGKVGSPQAKQRFQMLADAEDQHMQRLYQRAVALLGEAALPPLEQLRRELKVEHIEGGIETSPALAKVEEAVTDEMGALEIALEREYMAYDFYKRTSAVVGDPDARALLHQLALDERSHADTLLTQVAEIVQKR
jgi:rhodanese-related sulfurtransferase/rubrerythrin